MTDFEIFNQAIHGRSRPVAVVDLSTFDANVSVARSFAARAGKTIRIATKSLRVPELIKRVQTSGREFAGLMTFSAFETAFLAEQGFDDFLVAYPTLDDRSLDAVARVSAAGKTVRLVVDSMDGIAALGRASERAKLSRPLEAIVEVDASLRIGGRVHLGVRRSPIRSIEAVRDLVRTADKIRGVHVSGFMVYDAQIAGVPDIYSGAPWMVLATRVMKFFSRRVVAKRTKALAGEFSSMLRNGGGTGSLLDSLSNPCLTEVTMGSGFFCSHLFSRYRSTLFQPALFVGLEVVRTSDPKWVTCAGGGVVASGTPAWDRVLLPVYPKGLKPSSMEGFGEVQTPLHCSKEKPVLGSTVWLRPTKSGEPLERFQTVLGIEADGRASEFKTYRGYNHCFF